MKPLAEIHEEHEDLADVIVAMQENLPQAFLQSLGLAEIVQLYQAHVRSSLMFISNLVLQALDQLGGLPEGVEAEQRNVAVALEYDLWRHMYQAAEAADNGGLTVVRGSGIETP